ncbi:MAG TPA: heparinase II/III family protein [Candidatus Krumholzibacteria bacterium]|nr:heparinase II/III family protein [Candidatus Krumholzibacteria bacterium]
MRPVACLLLVLAVLAGAARGAPPGTPGEGALDIPPPGDYLAHPVYYDLFLKRYSDPDDLPDLRAGRVRVQHYDAVDAADFAWERSSGTNYTWWMQMQEMRFLLPLISSRRESDRAIARDWLIRWFGAHMAGGLPPRLWGEPMTWAYRAMVFVYYLRTEERRREPDEDVVSILRGAILEHQRQLASGGFFDEQNNHGFIDALGLYETTRVYHDDAARRLALERLRTLAVKSVSAQGFHREHAPYYHFVVLRWLDEMVGYFARHPDVDADTEHELRGITGRMFTAAYYLQDQRGGIPQVGDTDSSSVFRFNRRYRVTRAPGGAATCFDTDAGYAVYKGAARDRRYVVFRQPAGRIDMRAHAHADGLSVLYAVDGETVLGDGGKYSYDKAGRREYFQSGWAHNTILPPRSGSEVSRAPRVTEHPASVPLPEGTRWQASLTYGSFCATRTVDIPRDARTLVVTDTVRVGTARAPAPVSATVLWNIGPSVRSVENVHAGTDGLWAWRLTTHGGRRFVLSVRVTPADSITVAAVGLERGRAMLGWYSPAHGVARPAPVVSLVLGGEAVVETRVDELRRGLRRR